MKQNVAFPSFSVIIPSYNRRALVVRAISSVLATGADKLSVIVVDDGSTDATALEIRERFSSFPVTVMTQEHAGATAARNRGGLAATSKWLVFLDSDDEMTTNSFQVFADVLHAATKPGVICAAAELIDSEGQQSRVRRPRQLGGSYNNHTGLFLAGTFAVRRDIFQELGGFSTACRANQHKEFALRLIPYCDEHGYEIAYSNDLTVRIHEHAGEHLRSNMENLLEGSLYILRHHEDQIRKSPKHFSDWCSITGVYAAKLRRWNEAQGLFWKASLNCRPTDFLRLMASYTPCLRTYLWKRA